MSKLSRRTVVLSTIALFIGIVVCLLILQSEGFFSILDRQTSPDGMMTCTVYDGVNSSLFPGIEGFTIVDTGYSKDNGSFKGTTVYEDVFDGIWWSPDSRYLAIQMHETGTGKLRLSVADYVNSTEKNLEVSLNSIVPYNPFFNDMFVNVETRPDFQYRFIQWSEYGNFMLIKYDFTDTVSVEHLGYFWYDCDKGVVSGVMKLPTEIISN